MAQVFKIASAARKKVMQGEICLAQTEAMEMTVSAFLGSPWLQDLHDALAWQAARVDMQRPMPGTLFYSFKPFAWEGDVLRPLLNNLLWLHWPSQGQSQSWDGAKSSGTGCELVDRG